MFAIILAAGKGERIQEITRNIPKPLIEIQGKPILQHNIELCKNNGVKEIYINLHHLPEKIKDYFGNGEHFGVKIFYSYEENLLGTSGAIKKIFSDYNLIGRSENFFVLYGDNFSGYDFQFLIDKSKKSNNESVIAFHYRDDVKHSGVAEFDATDRILRFIEKPKEGETNSHWVNAGIYYLNPNILEFIPDGFSDFGKNIFPEMLKKNVYLYGVKYNQDLLAFDTYEMINKNISKLDGTEK